MTEQPGGPDAGMSGSTTLTAISVGISIPALVYMPFLVSSVTSEDASVFGLIALGPAGAAGLVLLAGWPTPWKFRYTRTAAAVIFAMTCWLAAFALWLAAFGHSKAG
jgi:hypothetical protein